MGAAVRILATDAKIKGPYSIIEKIGPELAKKYLATMGENRVLSPSRVQMFARDMKAGNWRLVPNPIAFDLNGKLVDGQHRLHAVIESGREVAFFVTRGVPTDAMEAIDRMRPRSAGDILRISGRIGDGAKASAAIATVIWRIQQDALFTTFRTPSIHEISETLDDFEDDIDVVRKAIGNRIEPGIPSGGAATIGPFAYMRRIDPQRVDRLVERVVAGEGDGIVRAMRQAIVQLQGHNNFTPRGVFALKLLRGIEAYLNGDRLNVLKMDSNVLERVREMREAAR